MNGKSHEREIGLSSLFDVCKDIKVLGIESFVRYFIGIVGILARVL